MDFIASILTIAGDVLIFLFDMIVAAVLGVLDTVLSSMDANVQDVVEVMNLIPAETWDLAYRLGLKECSVIIGGALMARFVLQLIPFVRLGS